MYSSALQCAYTLDTQILEMRERGIKIYPEHTNIFHALQLVQPTEVKAVIIGQDPYHGEHQANGLAFSVNDGIKIPPSLRNIFTELNNDLGLPIPSTGNLEPWAAQGVLLLNSVLTVESGKAGSHQYLGWQRVTQEILNICLELPQPIVFIAWGAFAHRIVDGLPFEGKLNKFRIYSSHPSPLGAYSSAGNHPAFIGSRPFSKTNELLAEAGSSTIDWTL